LGSTYHLRESSIAVIDHRRSLGSITDVSNAILNVQLNTQSLW
jgi:hypothetical protein